MSGMCPFSCSTKSATFTCVSCPLPSLPCCLQSVMSGDVPIELERQFLARHNHADLQVLKNIRATVEPRNRWAGPKVGRRGLEGRGQGMEGRGWPWLLVVSGRAFLAS